MTIVNPPAAGGHSKRRRLKAISKLAALAVMAGLILALIFVTSCYQQKTISATGSRITTGVLSSARTVTQTFQVPRRSLLSDLTLRFDTHYDQASVEHLYAELSDESGPVARAVVEVDALSNDTYCTLGFGAGILLEKGVYTLTLSSDDLSPGQIGISLWATDQCTEGSVLTVGNTVWEGYELCHYLTLQVFRPFSYALVGLCFTAVAGLIYLALFPTKWMRALRTDPPRTGRAHIIGESVRWGLWLLNPLLLFLALEGLRYADSTLRPTVWLFTWLLLLGCQLVLAFLFGASLLPCAVFDGCVMAYGLVNLVVIDGRGYPIIPSDLFALSTATEVSGAYRLSLDARQLICVLALMALIALELLLTFRVFPKPDRTKRKRRLCFRLAALLVGAGSLAWLWRNPVLEANEIEPHIWNRIAGANYNGAALDFFINLQFLFVDKPDGYSTEAAEQILASYLEEAGVSAPAQTGDYPNIILIMNESFHDFSMSGSLRTNLDPLEYIHSLEEAGEVSWGRCYVSIFGAGTSNSEFEALTGNSLAFFPSGSNVYQQYMTSTTYSLPYYLKQLGYSATAIHPCEAANWNRTAAYESMGFDAFLSVDDFEDPLIYRYISDHSCYEKIIETYEASKDDGPVFLFNVTMQNHGSYTQRMDFPEDVNVLSGDYPKADQYLSSLRLSDRAFEELITYFSAVEEPTMILMFGDHQPSLESEFYNQHLGLDGNWTLADIQEEYYTPYLLWTNFTDETQRFDLSANYLENLILDTAGIPLPPYNQFLAQLQAQIPVLDAAGYRTADGVWHGFGEETEVSSLLEDYQTLQYAYYYDRNKAETAAIFGYAGAAGP